MVEESKSPRGNQQEEELKLPPIVGRRTAVDDVDDSEAMAR